MTSSDSMALLLTLPPSRLCQILCLLARRANPRIAWTMLAWIESVRFKSPMLSSDACQRLERGLLPADSLRQLLLPGSAFSPTVLDLISFSAFAPLLAEAPPKPQRLTDTVEAWDCKRNHRESCLTSFLEGLPSRSLDRVLALPRSGFLRSVLRDGPRAAAYQRTALLFQVLLHLDQSGAVSECMLVGLFRCDNQHPTFDWLIVLDGLLQFFRKSAPPVSLLGPQ